MPALLNGFDPEVSQPNLRYGDSISLVPEGFNAVTAFAGSQDGQALIEKLGNTIGVPPNLRDCSFKIVPRNQYEEAKAVQKIVNAGVWDGGKRLAIPILSANDMLQDPSILSADFAKQHRIDNSGALRDFFAALVAKQEEAEGNEAEFKRQEGGLIRYGDNIQLLHESTGTYVTVTKAQAAEKGSKRVEQIRDGNELSVFVVAPAFKTYTFGEPMSSGDLTVFWTKKKIDGREYCLHMSALSGAQEMPVATVRRKLMVTSGYITGGEELNATVGSGRPTCWRPLLFSQFENKGKNEGLFKAEDIVCFYHKESDAYLDFDHRAGSAPHFRQSLRTADKARKKSSWMFKVENTSLHNAGSSVVCSESRYYRIKHLVSSHYLKQSKDKKLEMTLDYNDKATLFTFKQFSKIANSDEVPKGSLVYLRSAEGGWIGQADLKVVEGGRKPEHEVALDFGKQASEKDALLIMRLRHVALQAVDKVRRGMFVLSDYVNTLSAVPDQQSDAKPPQELEGSAKKTVAVTRECRDAVMWTLGEMCVACSHDDDPNPDTRQGTPNKLSQKLLRELGAIDLVMTMVDLPYKKGLNLAWMGDARFKNVRDIGKRAYSLMRLCVLENESNALSLYRHINVIRSHLGMGLGCTSALKEIFADKRELLQKVKEDLIVQFVDLVRSVRDARFLDFLQTICRCKGQPYTANQSLVCKQLLVKNADLLPLIRIDRSLSNDVRLGIHLPGTKDVETGKEFWIDIAKYAKVELRGERKQDLCAHIMEATWGQLDPQQRIVRYFIRCLELYSSLVAGRYQESLKALLTWEEGKERRFDFSYESMMDVIRQPKLPHLVRARFMNLMLLFYVDRDPQTSKPQILFTRVWNQVDKEKHRSELVKSAGSKPKEEFHIPVCDPNENFQGLIKWLLEDLPCMADAKDVEGQPGLTAQAMVGQLEYVAAQLALCDLLVDFGFMVKDRDETKPGFEQVTSLYASVFQILDVRTTKRGSKSKMREAVLMLRVRSSALQLLARLCNLRSNYRISLAVGAYEDIFDKMEKAGDLVKKREFLTKSFSSLTMVDEQGVQSAKEYFRGYDKHFDNLITSFFDKPAVAPEKIGSDQVDSARHSSKDDTLEMILALIALGRKDIQKHTFNLLLQHLGQRSSIVKDLAMSQLLVFPAACIVYEEVEYAIKRLSALKKDLVNKDKSRDAITEAMMLLRRMRGYITHSAENEPYIVRKNQTIMLNRELDEAVTNILSMNLERDTSRRDNGELEADRAANVERRDLFQECYNLLEALATDLSRAQQKLFPQIGRFSEHVGIELLNVADTIRAILKDNAALCMQVKETFLAQMIDAIVHWGRKPRWLNFFQVMLEINGSPVKRNQDLILSLLLQRKEAVLDLTGDYKDSPYISRGDPRKGKSRLDLILSGEHKDEPKKSLVLYHIASLQILSLCTKGKNPGAKGKMFALTPVETIVDNILDCQRRPDGTPAPEADGDAIHRVREAWLQLLIHVFLTSQDTVAIKQVLSEDRWWESMRKVEGAGGGKQSAMEAAASGSEEEAKKIDTNGSLVHHFQESLGVLEQRLSKLKEPPVGGELLNLEGALEVIIKGGDGGGRDEDKPAEEEGEEGGGGGGVKQAAKLEEGDVQAQVDSLVCHIQYGVSIASCCKEYFARKELWGSRSDNKEVMELAKGLVATATRCYEQVMRLGLRVEATAIYDMLETMVHHGGVDGELPDPVPDEDESPIVHPSREQSFSSGWGLFQARLCDFLKIAHPQEGKCKWEDIRRIAMLLGSEATFANKGLNLLKQLMGFIADKDCDSYLQLMGLQVVRAVLYMRPNDPVLTDDQREAMFGLYSRNLPPSLTQSYERDRDLTALQLTLARLGAVDVVISCVESTDPDVRLAALQLGVTVLEGGNRRVQDMFAAALSQPSNQGFFVNIRTLFDQCIDDMKEAKRKEKRVLVEKTASKKKGGAGGDNRRRSSVGGARQDAAKFDPHLYTTEAIKMMRRLCTGQHRALQDILRVQRLNRETVDLLNDVYRYMTALEPGIKKAIEQGDDSIVEGAIRGWLMLADAMQGPNFDNQSSLSKTGIVDLADRIYSKIRYTAERGGRARKAVVKFKAGSVAPEEQRSAEVLDRVDDFRCRLKTAVTTCLSSFLEGVQDDAIPRQMIMTAQWTNIMAQMVQCYEMASSFEVLSVGTLTKDSVVQEGLGYYALMRNVSSFDDQGSIDRVLSSHKRAEAYFQARTGYVEISRNDTLERLFFRLPDNCVAGGPLDKPFSEMYETEREDADKKNKEYLEHMVRLVDRERFHAGIRESYLAFTVNQWDQLCSLTFWWGVFLHCVLILGGYMLPDQENEAAALVEFGGDDGDHDVGIGFTFMFGVLPYTNLCARYMCYCYLGLCVLRALSFFWAECPLIVMESTSAAEEQLEKDGDGEEAASNEEDDGEDQDEALLIRGYVVSKEPPNVLDQDDDDNDGANKPQGAVANALSTLTALVTSPKVVYEVLFVLSGVLSVVLSQPLFSVFSLFELCFWSGSKTVIDAIRFNLGKMMQTMLLGLLTMYIWMILGMVLLRKQHNDEMCNNMFQCFMAYLYLSIRDNGVKEVLREFDPPRNIVEAFIGQDLFILAIFWDITYWLLFILILVAIITGIVIDAFGGMREAKEADESDLKANCFVCNLARFPLDQSVGFDHHVRVEHNPRWYLFFLMYLRGKAETQMTGQERYVFDRVWPSQDYRWLPRETTFSLKEEDSQGDVIQTVQAQVQNIESNVEQLATAIARIEDHLAQSRQQ